MINDSVEVGYKIKIKSELLDSMGNIMFKNIGYPRIMNQIG